MLTGSKCHKVTTNLQKMSSYLKLFVCYAAALYSFGFRTLLNDIQRTEQI